MSKLDSQLLSQAVDKILAFSRGEEVDGTQGKKRNFLETIDLQIALKNYDPSKDKRFNGSFRLPVAPRPNMAVCMLGNEEDNKKALGAGIDAMNVEDMKKLNKNKKLVRKLLKKYGAFLSSASVIKQIPRLLGPAPNRAGKFPALINPGDDVADKILEARSTVKFQMKKVLCLSAAIANVGMTKEEITRNASLSINFLVSLLKRNWQNVGALYIKSTMGPSFQIHF